MKKMKENWQGDFLFWVVRTGRLNIAYSTGVKEIQRNFNPYVESNKNSVGKG